MQKNRWWSHIYFFYYIIYLVLLDLLLNSHIFYWISKHSNGDMLSCCFCSAVFVSSNVVVYGILSPHLGIPNMPCVKNCFKKTFNIFFMFDFVPDSWKESWFIFVMFVWNFTILSMILKLCIFLNHFCSCVCSLLLFPIVFVYCCCSR